MSCKNCASNRLFEVYGKCDDRFCLNGDGQEYDGYVPEGSGLGEGDAIEFILCADCGTIQGNFPLPKFNPNEDNEDD